MKMMFLIMMTNSMILMKLNHPISMGSMLIFQSILTALVTNLLSKNSWYSMILFITFSSGMMIMFIYMSSITSNEKFYPSIKQMIMFLTSIMMILMMSKDKTILFESKWMENFMSFEENEEKKSIYKMISMKKILMTTLTTLIILIVLIAISSIINSHEGPLKIK
uniref:NADH dehydrogenase subunit 6 n=1 Tax=Stenocranus matsumurai TaxID=1291382 RepID=A0A7S4YZ21_9HEMI|nr:NADH dehydrogenase subunit 6 [Stenocranus matsumurai]